MLTEIFLIMLFEFGYMPSVDMTLYSSDYADGTNYTDHTLYTDFQATVQWRWLYVGGGVKTYFWPRHETPFFFPFRGDFFFHTGLDFGHLQIGYRHICDHAIAPFLRKLDPYGARDRYINEIFVRLSGKQKIF